MSVSRPLAPTHPSTVHVRSLPRARRVLNNSTPSDREVHSVVLPFACAMFRYLTLVVVSLFVHKCASAHLDDTVSRCLLDDASVQQRENRTVASHGGYRNVGPILDGHALGSRLDQYRTFDGWQRRSYFVRLLQMEFQTSELPLARIKKIMKLDDDVKMISAEVPVLFAKAAEIFIHELTLRAWLHTEESKRRTLQVRAIDLRFIGSLLSRCVEKRCGHGHHEIRTIRFPHRYRAARRIEAT